MRLLIVEDDIQIASFITKGLIQEGYAVDHVADGNDGLHLALTEPYDVMIIDIMLPGITGLKIVESIRTKKITTPVLILSAKRSVGDRVRGIQKGSDDYMIKPFAFSELRRGFRRCSEGQRGIWNLFISPSVTLKLIF